MVDFFLLAEFYENGPDHSRMMPGEKKECAVQEHFILEDTERMHSIFGENFPTRDMRIDRIVEARQSNIDINDSVLDVPAFLLRITTWIRPPIESRMYALDPYGFIFEMCFPNRALRAMGLYSELTGNKVGLFLYEFPEKIAQMKSRLEFDAPECDRLWDRVCDFPS